MKIENHGDKCFDFPSFIQNYLNLYYTCLLDTLYPEDDVSVFNTYPFSLCVYVCVCECVNMCMCISQDASFWSCFFSRILLSIVFSDPVLILPILFLLDHIIFLFILPFAQLKILLFSRVPLLWLHSIFFLILAYSVILFLNYYYLKLKLSWRISFSH